MDGGSKRKCFYAHCDSHEESSIYYTIEKEKTSGGRDWTPFVGKTLCHACYERYKRRGTFERARNRQLPLSSRKCTYEHCDFPRKGRNFFQIEEGMTSGEQDWSPVVGHVLCKTCYNRFLRRGTLERAMNRPLEESAKQCTYEHCDNPTKSHSFYQIDFGTAAGGQDWSELAGRVLCKACYLRFSKRGTLQRGSRWSGMASESRPSKKQKTSPSPRQQPSRAKAKG